MKTGALIVAAGMSTRMKQTKQLMKIGKYTMIEHIVRGFYEAGVEDVAVVTGYCAADIKNALEGYPVTFLYNENYVDSQMFDSVKIGLEYWKDRCDRILFCPVDVPCFSVETVKELLTHKEDWIYPFCNGRIGHPILISASFIPSILGFTGDGGLKGALDSLGIDPVVMEVADAGSVMDADTPEDYEKLETYYKEKIEK